MKLSRKYKFGTLLTLILALGIAALMVLSAREFESPACSGVVFESAQSLPRDKSSVCYVSVTGQDEGLPSWIFGLSNLRILSARGERLDSLPARLSSLQKLEELHLGYDSLSLIDAPLPDMPNVQRLYISRNNAAEFPAELAQMSALEELTYVSPNDTTPVSSELVGLTRLKSLHLVSGDYSSFLTRLTELAGLEELTLAGGQLEELPEALGDLRNLRSLSVQMLNLGRLPNPVVNLEELTTLRIGSARFAELPPDIGRLGGLEELVIENTPRIALKDGAFAPLSEQTMPVYPEHRTSSEQDVSRLAKAPFSRMPDSFKNLTRLKTLSIRGTRLRALPAGISQMKDLETLALAHNELARFDLDISSHAKLASLDISDNPLVSISQSVTRAPVLRQFGARNLSIPVPNVYHSEQILDPQFAETYYVYAYQPQRFADDTGGSITVQRQRLQTGDVETLLTFDAQDTDASDVFAYHGPSNRLAYSTAGGVYSYDTVSKRLTRVYTYDTSGQKPSDSRPVPSQLSWSGSGRYLGITGGILDLKTGNLRTPVAADSPETSFGSVYWSYDQDRYVTIARDNFFLTGVKLAVSEPDDPYVVRDLTGFLKLPPGAFESAALSQDGKRIAFSYTVYRDASDPPLVLERRLYSMSSDAADLVQVYSVDCTVQPCTSDSQLKPYFIPGSHDIAFADRRHVLNLLTGDSVQPVAVLPASPELYRQAAKVEMNDLTVDLDMLQRYYVKNRDDFILKSQDADARLKALSRRDKGSVRITSSFMPHRYEHAARRVTVPQLKDYASRPSGCGPIGERLADLISFTRTGFIMVKHMYGFNVRVYDDQFSKLIFENSTPMFVSTIQTPFAIYVPLGFST